MTANDRAADEILDEEEAGQARIDMRRNDPLQHALSFKFDEYGWGVPGMNVGGPTAAALDTYMIDQDFWSDLRNLLICRPWEMLHLIDGLETYMLELKGEYDEVSEDGYHRRNMPRYLDIRWAALTFCAWHKDSRDALTEFAMKLSLCPIHFIDWAICFDDEDKSCRQVRAIFPHSHDT